MIHKQNVYSIDEARGDRGAIYRASRLAYDTILRCERQSVLLARVLLETLEWGY